MNKKNEIQLLAIDTFVSALNRSNLSDIFIIRGSYISRFYLGSYSRVCEDLDLLYLEEYSQEKIENYFFSILDNIESDKISFDKNSVVFKAIWEDTISPGVRVFVDYIYDSNRYVLQIDFGAGDPLVSSPKKVLVNKEKNIFANVVGVEILAAWKLHGLFEFLNGRWYQKTLWDFYLLCKFNTLDLNIFREAIKVAFESRLDPPEILKRLLYGDFGQSRESKKHWLSKVSLLTSGDIPPLEKVLEEIRTLLIPILELENDGTLLTLAEIVNYRIEKLRLLNNSKAKQKLATLSKKTRILESNSYNSIPHLSGSRTGSADKTIDKYQEIILLETKKVMNDIVVVQEKLDGSCVCAFRKNNEIFALGRDGTLADDSVNEGLKLWAEWVDSNKDRFLSVLENGERICGEWLAMAHGTRYKLNHEPFVVFDFFNSKNQALIHDELESKIKKAGFISSTVLHKGEPCSIEKAISLLGKGFHGSIDLPEGLVWRLERGNRTIFRAKYVFKYKKDGCFLPEISKNKPIWNWHPKEERSF